jgi:hypothetical protein
MHVHALIAGMHMHGHGLIYLEWLLCQYHKIPSYYFQQATVDKLAIYTILIIMYRRD